MRRVPEWVEQVVGGLSDGKDWVVRRMRGLPTPIRATGWLTFQAVLFKLQPQFWRGLVAVVGFVTGLLELQFHAQLLLLVIAILAVQTALAENRFKQLRIIVKNMDSDAVQPDVTISDGGSDVEIAEDSDDWNSARVYAACSAVIGGVIGVGWGPAGVIGLAVLGAMIGDEWAQRTLDE